MSKDIKILKEEIEKWKTSYDKLAEFTGERFNRSNKEIAQLKAQLKIEQDCVDAVLKYDRGSSFVISLAKKVQSTRGESDE